MTSYKLLLGNENDDLTLNQYFFIDCIIIFIGCCLISISLPKFKIDVKDYSNVSNNKKFLFSIIGHSIFQVILTYLYFTLILKGNFYGTYDEVTNSDISLNNLTIKNSYCFILACFQNISFVFVFNYFSIQKENFFKNRFLTIYLFVVLLIIAEMISLDIFQISSINFGKYFVKFIPLGYINNTSEKSRIILFGFGCLSFIYTMFWEWIVYYCFNDKYSIFSNINNTKNDFEIEDDNEDKTSINEVNNNKNDKNDDNNDENINYFGSDSDN